MRAERTRDYGDRGGGLYMPEELTELLLIAGHSETGVFRTAQSGDIHVDAAGVEPATLRV